jgi:hypothetical protein
VLKEYNQAIEEYHQKWHAFVAERQNQAFFKALTPTAVGWKTVDLVDFDKRFAELRDYCDQIHLGWINERWIGTLHLKEDARPWGIRIIKLMQRRPKSTDTTGLDHIDFYSQEVSKAKLQAESNLKWSEETNGSHAECKWLSIWFAGTEAKLRTDTVLQSCIDELDGCQQALLEER